MTLFKVIMRRFFKQIKRIQNFASSKINKVYFKLNNIKYGKKLIVHGRIGLRISPLSEVTIGDSFYSSNGNFINPISRNISGCIATNEGAVIIIGDNVSISSTSIWSRKFIKIGNNVKIGADSLILDSDFHSINHLARRIKAKDISHNVPVIIEDDVLIGARCIILKGVIIGARSVIGAGSIVTKSIPADSIAAGNPCRVLKLIDYNK